jgi:hypothetical protein
MYGQYGYNAPSYMGNTYPNAYPYQRQMTTPQMQMQPQQQAQPQMQSQPQQPNLPQIQELRYATEEEAKAFIVFPNASAFFIDLPKNRLYIKSANNSGISNFDYFSLTPINADGTPIKPIEEKPQIDMGEYIKKSDLANLGYVTMEQLNSILSKLTSQQTQSVGVKTNGTGTISKPQM